MKHTLSLLFLVSILLFSCAPISPQQTPSPIPSNTQVLPSLTASYASVPPTPLPTRPTVTPSHTLAPSDTPVLPTPTTSPQPVLLRRPCGRDYNVRADYPLQVYYGGWGVTGKELADQWATALEVELIIDGEKVAGELQPPADELPYNCKSDPMEELYWLYSVVVIPGLSSGDHNISVIFYSLRSLPDGSGLTFGPGQLLENTFRVTAK